MPIAYHDGQWVEKNAIRIGLTDFGFSRGLTIFELARVYGGKPFRLDDHLARLQNGVKALGLQLPMTLAELGDTARQLCGKNKFPHSALKFYFTAGESRASPYSFAGDHAFTPHLVIAEDEVHPAHPEAPYGLDFYRRGQRLKIMPCERALPAIKSSNYMQGFIASREAGAECDDILFTHHKGYVTEATRSNFFCVIDGVLCTPHEDMLFGITRKVILEIARSLNMPVAERTLMPTDVLRSTEAFTTGSIAEMVPVRQIDDHILPTTMEGPVFAKLRREFSSVLEKAR